MWYYARRHFIIEVAVNGSYQDSDIFIHLHLSGDILKKKNRK